MFIHPFGCYRPGELLVLPEEEAHRLAWVGVVEAIGFEPDVARGEAELRARMGEEG